MNQSFINQEIRWCFHISASTVDLNISRYIIYCQSNFVLNLGLYMIDVVSP
jgi:hypothetical protein